MDGPNSGRTLDLLPRGDVKRMLDRGFTNDNIAARQREFEPLPHRRNGPDENQGLFCSIPKPHCQLYTCRSHTCKGREGAAYRQDLSGQCAQGNDRGRIIALTYAKAALPLREMPHICRKLPSGCYTRPWSSIELATFMKPEILAPFT